MQQLSIFDVINEVDLDTEIKNLLDRNLITVEGKAVVKTKIVSVHIPSARYAEPSLITQENNNYVWYSFTHGHLYETKESHPFFNRFPAYYWTWLDRSLAPIYY